MEEGARIKAEELLSQVWGRSVQLFQGKGLGGSNRSNVYRYFVKSDTQDLPPSVIIKQAVGESDESYNPDVTNGPSRRLFNEWAGLQFLTDLAGPNSPAPLFYGGDREVGLIVLQDLGTGGQLDHLLLGEDPVAAKKGLMGFMNALGQMHAISIDHRDTFNKLRETLGPNDTLPNIKRVVEGKRQILQEFADAVDVKIHPGIKSDFAALEVFLDTDNPFIAYSHRDPCPDNCLLVEGKVKLLDFEFGNYRHALLDGVYGRIHFPTCWCVNRLPPHIYEEMEQVYRIELVKGCPEAGDDEIFNRAIVEACACHLLNIIQNKLLAEDAEWGISTMRQRALVRLDRFSEISAAVGHLEILGVAARDIASSLRQQWSIEMDMSLYPAFR